MESVDEELGEIFVSNPYVALARISLKATQAMTVVG